MPPFKVGDKVRCIEPVGEYFKYNEVCTIRRIVPSSVIEGMWILFFEGKGNFNCYHKRFVLVERKKRVATNGYAKFIRELTNRGLSERTCS